MLDTKLHQEIDQLIAEYPDWQQRYGNINPWLYGNYTELYVRLGSSRVVSGIRYRAFDVSNIAINEKYRRKGIFINLLTFLENKKIPIYVENVQDSFLCTHLERRGYQRLGHFQLPCYFKDSRFSAASINSE